MCSGRLICPEGAGGVRARDMADDRARLSESRGPLKGIEVRVKGDEIRGFGGARWVERLLDGDPWVDVGEELNCTERRMLRCAIRNKYVSSELLLLLLLS